MVAGRLDRVDRVAGIVWAVFLRLVKWIGLAIQPLKCIHLLGA